MLADTPGSAGRASGAPPAPWRGPRPGSPSRLASRARAGRALAPLLAAGVLGGCLGAPKIEDRWTRVDIVGANVVPYQTLPAGTSQTITGRMTVTYRAIVTGVAVAELRASGTLSPASVVIHPDAARLPMASDIERVLQNSVSLARDTRAVTGWDHLIQPIDFTFTAALPTGATAGLFLLCYLGAGTEIQLADGTDSLAVTPFGSSQYQILPVGMGLTVAGP